MKRVTEKRLWAFVVAGGLGGFFGSGACTEPNRHPVPPDPVDFSTEPLQCKEVQCKPPSCCGQLCGDGGTCCKNTLCSAEGKCVPEGCKACGGAMCQYTADVCQASCVKPKTCEAACTQQADCDPGTFCREVIPGTDAGMKCLPTACQACVGMKALCQVSASCEGTCASPASCGANCTGDAGECGAGAYCGSFGSQADAGPILKCVPDAFQSLCNYCSPDPCMFYGGGCTVQCARKDGGVEVPPDSGQPQGPVLVPDAGTPDAGKKDAGTTVCANCCRPCEPDAGDPKLVCCEGNTCVRSDGGAYQCEPTFCQSCDYGCNRTCP